MKIHCVVGARPSFMEIAPLMREMLGLPLLLFALVASAARIRRWRRRVSDTRVFMEILRDARIGSSPAIGERSENGWRRIDGRSRVEEEFVRRVVEYLGKAAPPRWIDGSDRKGSVTKAHSDGVRKTPST